MITESLEKIPILLTHYVVQGIENNLYSTGYLHEQSGFFFINPAQGSIYNTFEDAELAKAKALRKDHNLTVVPVNIYSELHGQESFPEWVRTTKGNIKVGNGSPDAPPVPAILPEEDATLCI